MDYKKKFNQLEKEIEQLTSTLNYKMGKRDMLKEIVNSPKKIKTVSDNKNSKS